MFDGTPISNVQLLGSSGIYFRNFSLVRRLHLVLFGHKCKRDIDQDDPLVMRYTQLLKDSAFPFQRTPPISLSICNCFQKDTAIYEDCCYTRHIMFILHTKIVKHGFRS